MENFILEQGRCLEELAESLKRNKAHMVKDITEKLYTGGITDGSMEDCGRAMSEILDAKGLDEKACLGEILGTKNKWAIYLLGNIKVIHPNNDCPYCGYETEKFSDGLDGISWEEKRCLNPDCDFTESGEKQGVEFDLEDEW